VKSDMPPPRKPIRPPISKTMVLLWIAACLAMFLVTVLAQRYL
jgi:cytochrome c-type biogenesis protein CcmH/NrfF